MSDQKSNQYRHPHPAVAVDVVIFTLRDDRLQVLLIQRGLEPFLGRWALPGGFVRINEALEAAAQRELREETGICESYLEQVGAFGQPDRDPRERVISVAYFAIIPADKVALQAGSDARDVTWRALQDLPAVAFDHRVIIDSARLKLLEKLNRTTIALEFLPPEFTLTELQRVFEIIRGESMDKRNFRKWAEGLSVIKSTGKTRRGGQHRPAALYKANSKAVLPMPIAPTEAAVSADMLGRKADTGAAYRKGYEDAVAALHRSFAEAEKTLLRSVAAR
jgi:8-oxo-dGTP diphosphatase